MRIRLATGAVLGTALAVAGCASGTPQPPSHSALRSPPPHSATRTPSTSASTRSTPAVRSATRTPPTSAPPEQIAAVTGAQLPRGGRTVLPNFRVVAFYGAAGTPALGVLGDAPPDTEAVAIERQAAAYARYGRRVQPAMELLATVAQRSAGPDGDYSAPVPDATIASYLAAAHRYRMLLILDLQPGRSTFAAQVRRLAPFLADPSVDLALDPEWKIGPGQQPGAVIGSSDAADINTTARYLAHIVAAHHLPDKLLLVHQFRPQMLPDRSRIERPKGIEVVLHADGFGTIPEKLASYRRLAIPDPPFRAGFKLFYRQDTPTMTPAQVMALQPQPDVITYE
jgi:hypothetical protein